MWHDAVSSLDATWQGVISGFLAMGAQHPLATAGIVLLFLTLAAMLVAESMEDRRDGELSRKVGPIELERDTRVP